MLLRVSILHSFVLLSGVPLWMDHILFVCSRDERRWFVSNRAIMNNAAAVNVLMCLCVSCVLCFEVFGEDSGANS